MLTLQPPLAVPIGFPVPSEVEDGPRHNESREAAPLYFFGTVMSMSGASGCFMPTML